jgi:hypothetical protein
MSSLKTSLKPTHLSYDDEFLYDDGMHDGEYRAAQDIESRTAEIMRRVEEESDIVQSSQQTREEFFRLHELNANARKDSRFPNQEELKLQREGRILHMNEFLGCLKRCGLNCWYSEKGGMPKTLGLYVGHDKTAKCSHEAGAPHYVGFVQVPFMQEYEELNFDHYNVPLGSKRRGWRTVILKLLEQGLVTVDKVDEIFGKPATGPVSRRYNEYVAFLRSKH